MRHLNAFDLERNCRQIREGLVLQRVFAGPWSSGCHQISCSLGEDPGFMSTPLVITFLLPDGRSTHLVSGIFHFRGHNAQRTSFGTSSMGPFSDMKSYTWCILVVSIKLQCHQSIYSSGKRQPHIHDLLLTGAVSTAYTSGIYCWHTPIFI